MSTGGPRHAHREGFDLHANVAVAAGDRRRLERLCRYVLRAAGGAGRAGADARRSGAAAAAPAVARRHAGDPLRAQRIPREALAALVPRPRANLLLYHGAFAARGCWRVAAATGPRAATPDALPAAAVTPPRRAEAWPSGPSAASAISGPTGPRAPPAAAHVRPRHVAWAELLRRTFALDVLACAQCGGRLRLVATIADPLVIRKILTHLGLPVEPPRPAPPRPATGRPDDAP